MAPDSKSKPKAASTTTTKAPKAQPPAPTTPSTPSTPTSQSQAASLLTAARKHHAAQREKEKGKDKEKQIPPQSDFTEADLLAFQICPDKPSLVAAMNDLLRSQDFALLQSSSPITDIPSSKPITYRLRAESAVKLLKNLTTDAKQLYAMIEGAGANGIWTKTLTQRSKLHQVMVTKALKALEASKLVKQFRSVRLPNRRLYLLSHLKPPEEATGGAWFSDGELDSDMIEGASRVATYFIEGRSWREGPSPSEKVIKEVKELEKGKREVGVSAGYWAEVAWLPMVRKRRIMLPYPKGCEDYPTASDVLDFMEMKGVFRGKDVSVPDVQVLLDMLVYDGKLEKMGTKKEAVDGAEDELETEEETVEKTDGEAEESGSDFEHTVSKKRKRPLAHNGDVDDVYSESEGAPTGEDDEIYHRRKKTKAKRNTSHKPELLKDKTHFVSMYRTVRQPFNYNHETGLGSALAETPCGRCPSFALCADDGPVNAKDCEYFPGWLERAVA